MSDDHAREGDPSGVREGRQEVVEATVSMAAEHKAEPSRGAPRAAARHMWFDPFRTAEGIALRSIASAVVEEVRAYELAEGLRKNRRRPADAASFETMVGATVANLALLSLGVLISTQK